MSSQRMPIVAVALLGAATVVSAKSLSVATPTETCFVEGQRPRITIAIFPADAVKAARIQFRPALGDGYQTVEMQRVGGHFQAELPAPLAKAGSVTYFAEALNHSAVKFPTPQVEARVVARAEECGQEPSAAGASDGNPATGGATAAHGRGIGSFLTSRTGLILGGAVVLGGATTAIVLTRHDDHPASPSR
jgi:hypothetical protein